MKTEIKVPSMGESVSEATIATILKSEGSQVKIDDELIEMETAKVNQVLYASETGIVSYVVKPNDVVTIGQVIGYIETSDTSKGDTVKKEAPKSQKTKESHEKIDSKIISTKQLKKQETPVSNPSSSARLTREQVLKELSIIEPTLEAPEIFKSPNFPFNSPSNLQTPQEKPSTASPKSSQSTQQSPNTGEREETRRKMTPIRKVIARRMVEAQQTTAMLTTFNEIDMSQVITIREHYKETFVKEHGVKLGFMSFFVKACVDALEAFPDLNSYIDGDEIVHREYFDIGIAVGTDRGLVVPVVRGCNHLTFAGIEKEIEMYAVKAREGKLAADDLVGGGFTVTNGGVYGSLLSTPIINPPQSGILGMHKIMKRPIAIDDQVVIRPMMYVALSYDHRIVDGKEAVSFLVHLKNSLEDPSRILLGL